MNRIRKKLASDRGASITFALLLFLVCAVLCSVIITAASTASGRMASLAETDQRYYTVTSAAELLRSLIDGQTVSVVKVEKEEVINTYKNSIIDPASTLEKEKVTELYMVNGKATPGTELMTEDLISDAPSFTSIPEDAAYKVFNADTGDLGAPSDRTFNLQSNFYSNTGAEFDAYAAVAREEFESDGTINLTIYNKYADNGSESSPGSQYTLKMTFKLGKSEDTSIESVEKNNNDSQSIGGVVTYTTTTTSTTKTIYTYNWKLTDVKTGPTSEDTGTLLGG